MQRELDEILLSLRTFQFVIREHASERMIERQVTLDDISNLGHDGKLIKAQRNSRFVIKGTDLDEEDLVIIVQLLESTYIVTVGLDR